MKNGNIPENKEELRKVFIDYHINYKELEPLDGVEVWQADVTADTNFIGTVYGVPVILVGSSTLADPNAIGCKYHEVAHIKYEPAVPRHVKEINDGLWAHWGPVAVRYEEQADYFTCLKGYGKQLRNYLAASDARYRSYGFKYTGDTLDRIARIDHWLKSGEWTDNGLERLPTKEEVETAAKAAGEDLTMFYLMIGFHHD